MRSLTKQLLAATVGILIGALMFNTGANSLSSKVTDATQSESSHIGDDQTTNSPYHCYKLGIIKSVSPSSITLNSCDYIDKGAEVTFSVQDHWTSISTDLSIGRHVYVSYLNTSDAEGVFTAHYVEDAEPYL